VTDLARSRVIGELLLTSLRAGNPIRIRAHGTSMVPAIWPGDVLTVAPATATTIVPGQIALTLRTGRWFVHRVIDRHTHGGTVVLVTRGDALDHADPVAAPVDIPGIVIARNGRALGEIPPARTGWLVTLTSRVMRSRAALALIIKLHAFARRLELATL
jgi:signal peptidase